jgi:hypothetical protein
MLVAVALAAPQPQLVDHRVPRLVVRRIMVVLEELGRAATAADAIAVVDDPLLSARRVPVRAGSVDRAPFGVVDQRT